MEEPKYKIGDEVWTHEGDKPLQSKKILGVYFHEGKKSDGVKGIIGRKIDPDKYYYTTKEESISSGGDRIPSSYEWNLEDAIYPTKEAIIEGLE